MGPIHYKKNGWGFFSFRLGFSFSFANLHSPPSRVPNPKAQSAAQLALTGPFLPVNGRELENARAGTSHRPSARWGVLCPEAAGDIPITAAPSAVLWPHQLTPN